MMGSIKGAMRAGFFVGPTERRRAVAAEYRVEGKGDLEMARQMRQFASQMFIGRRDLAQVGPCAQCWKSSGLELPELQRATNPAFLRPRMIRASSAALRLK